MDVRKTSRKLAIISCEPDYQEPMRFRGKHTTIRNILSITFKELGLEPIIHRPVEDARDFPAIGDSGAVVVGGSKLNLFDDDITKNDWMARLLDFIRDVHEKVPVLGICYGHQAVARAFGASIEKFGPDVGYEVGFAPVWLTPDGKEDVLFQEMPEIFDAIFSHFTYVSEVPDSKLLAISPFHDSIQAFRVSDSTWGIQFHPEYTASCIRDTLEQRRAAIEHLIDVDMALATLKREERVDTLTLHNFARFVSQD